jgi:hypothetical protein
MKKDKRTHERDTVTSYKKRRTNVLYLCRIRRGNGGVYQKRKRGICWNGCVTMKMPCCVL